MRRVILLGLVCVCSLLANDKPNVIFIFADDLGYGDLGCYGHPYAQTPALDQLAEEGTRYTQAYVTGVTCCPSRTGAMTGRHPARFAKYMADHGFGNSVTITELLKSDGYRTGHFGKWHMGGQRDVDNAPAITEYGFDASLTNFEGMGPKLLPLTLKPGQDPAKPGRIWANAERLGQGVRWMQRSEITRGFVDEAIPFIDKAAGDGEPFYINLWPDDVHSPFWPPTAKWGDGSKRRLYLSVLETMDEQLGKLFDFVRNDSKLAGNTLILACSDNGAEKGAGVSGPFRGFKTHLFEGGIRSSLVAWGPGLIPSNKNEDTGKVNLKSVCSAVDLVPTLLELAEVPHAKGVKYDGESLPDVLLGKSEASRKQPLFFRRPPDRDSFYGVKDLPDLAVRSGKWKLLCEYDGADALLYDMQTDRGETKDLSKKHPEVVSRLTKAVIAWHKSMPPDNGPALASKPKKKK